MRKVNYNIIIYNIRVKEIFKNIKKKEAKILIKVNKNIYKNLNKNYTILQFKLENILISKISKIQL